VSYGECFHPNQTRSFPVILSLKLPDKIRFTTYVLWMRTNTSSNLNADNTPSRAKELPHSWTIEGSNNESDWVTLDTQTGQTTFTMRREYAFVNTDAWNNYRINITEGGSMYMVIGELQFQTPQINEIIFDGYNTINLVNIPEDTTKVELFRDGVYLTKLIITDTAASVKIGTSGSYNARIYKGSYLLVETPVVVVGTISSAFVVEPVARLVATYGSWENKYDYLYFETTLEGRFVYNLVYKDTTNSLNGYDIEYNPIDGEWYDVGAKNPYTWGIDDTGTNTSAFPTAANMKTQYWYQENGGLNFQFDNPYYVAPVTELIFNGSDTINLVNIPEDATKVELFRNGIQLDDMVIDGTEAIVQIGTPARYQAYIYNAVGEVSYLLVETPILTIVEPVVEISSVSIYDSNGAKGLYDTQSLSSFLNNDLDGSGSFNPYLMFQLTDTKIVSTVNVTLISTYQKYKTIAYRIGKSETEYEEFSAGNNDYSNSRDFTFTLATPIETDHVYFGFISSTDIYAMAVQSISM